MPTSIVTTEDLITFKAELLEAIKELMIEHTHPMPKTWLRSGDVMKMLNISHGALQNLRNKNVIPFYRLEGIILYDALEIDQLILENNQLLQEEGP